MKEFKFLTEITMPTIKQNNISGFPNTKKRQNVSHLVNVLRTKFEPYVPSEKLIVVADTVSNNHQYQTAIEFDNVNYQENGLASFKGTDGEEHKIDRLTMNSVDVNVNCTCADFKYRFAHQHYQNKSLVGEPPEQYVKVPGSNRPPVNPDNVLGACKHILALEKQLKRLGLVT
jgi:hypothetical protein